MISCKEDLRNFFISVVVVSGAFTIQNISFGFFMICFSIVLLSYLAHEAAHRKLSQIEGMKSKSSLYGIGIIITLATGILTRGFAVLAIPLLTGLRSTEDGRWLRKTEGANDRELGLISTSGPLVNLIIATAFLGLYSVTNIYTLWMVSLINFCIGISNLIPVHPFDGGNTVLWGGWLWLTTIITGSVGIIGLVILL